MLGVHSLLLLGEQLRQHQFLNMVEVLVLV